MYTLSDPTRAKLLDQMRSDDPTSCGDEIALLRTLIQEAAESNKPALVERLVSSMARCQVAHVNAQVKNGNLMERSKLMQICLALATLLSDTLEAHGIENQADICEWFAARVPAVIEQVATPQLEAPRDE